MRCRFNGESDLTPEQKQKFRDQFVNDCAKKDQKIERNILLVIGIIVFAGLSILSEDITLACVYSIDDRNNVHGGRIMKMKYKVHRCAECGKTTDEADIYYDGDADRCFECIKTRCADSQPICSKCGKAVDVLYEGRCEDCLRGEYSAYRYREDD